MAMSVAVMFVALATTVACWSRAIGTVSRGRGLILELVRHVTAGQAA